MYEFVHKYEYNLALSTEGRKGPEWEDLTEEQRIKIRKANDDHRAFMASMADAIANGTDLPNPFKDV